MRTPVDALRSVVRYVALALGPDYEVRLSTEKGTFQRPSARVAQVPSIQMITQSWWLTKYIASYAVTVYPVAGSEGDASQMNAIQAADLLWRALVGPGVGAAVIRAPVDSHRGTPARVPLYDYAGVPLDGPEAFVGETQRDSRDFLHLEGVPEVQVVNDPADELLYSVAANIRMSWLRSAAVPSVAPNVQSVDAGAQPHG